MNFKTGGQKVIERLVEAYGFTTRQALCDHLGVSKSTLATRYMRDIFPAEWVVQCVLETGVSLEWLVTGKGPLFDKPSIDVISLSKKKLIDGVRYDSGFSFFDKVNLSENYESLSCLVDNNNTFIIEQNFKNIDDGLWLIDIDDRESIRDVTRLPGGRIKIESGDRSFEASIIEVKFKGKIKARIINIA